MHASDRTAYSLFSRLSSRLRSARPGSVLIFVITILVMLALLGTAYVAAARVERFSTQHNTANTQIDLLVEGVMNMVQAAIVADLFDSDGSYRPANAVTYDHWDAAVTAPTATYASPADFWLAERLPDAPDGVIVWPAISWPLLANGSGANPYQFDLPDSAVSRTLSLPKRSFAPDSVILQGRIHPALREMDGATPVGTSFLAADADGDGIADAGLFELPVGKINGVTYYAAIRIVDNNSALNASIAGRRTNDTDGAGLSARNERLFPTNVGLAELLARAGEMTDLENYRSAGVSPAGVRGDPAGRFPTDDTGKDRADFRFLNRGDALWMQLGRRLGNPGFAAPAARYRALPLSDTVTLAHQFCLTSANSTPGLLEQLLPQSLYYNAPVVPYDPADVETWYSTNFNYSGSTFSLRPLVVTRSPVSNLSRPKFFPVDLDGNGKLDDPAVSPTQQPVGMAAYRPNQAKTSPNTATFQELWRTYWNIMSGNPANQTPFGTAGSTIYDPYVAARPPYTHPQRMFRSPIRDVRIPFGSGTARLDPFEALKLRAAIAAVNTIDMRDSDSDVTTASIPLNVHGITANNGGKGFIVTVHGIEPQPFIAEVFVQTDVQLYSNADKSKNNNGKSTGGNNNGKNNPICYIAVELYNPTDSAISLRNWKIARFDNRATAYGSALGDLKQVIDFGEKFPTIPAKGYLVLTNCPADSGTTPAASDNDYARYRPPSAKFHSPSPTILYVDDLEAVLNNEMVLLRPRRADGTRTSASDGLDYNEAQILTDLVPVDQFDFTGMLGGTTTQAVVFHYVRPSGPGSQWRFVYPGRYDGAKTQQRHDGAQQASWNPTTASDPWAKSPPAPFPPVNLGGPDATASYSVAGGGSSPVFNIPLPTRGCVGPNPVGASNNAWPFGGFARDGDLLAVPFFGAYVIGVRQDNGNTKIKYPLAVHSLSMDTIFAEDADPADDAVEQVGRFCPTFAPNDWYAWAHSLLDYMAVLNPSDDYFPNARPDGYTPAPQAVANALPNIANAGQEDLVPIEGLININTAPWKVLAALPMVSDPQHNEQLARAIVAHRRKNGPFKSIWELNNVPIKDAGGNILYYFKDAWWQHAGAPYDADDADGDFTPAGDGITDGIRGDYEEQFLMVSRISNLITTRSDSFTCYILLQGWRGAGTADAEVVAQRRVAFLADRTGVVSTDKKLKVTLVPQN